MASSAGPAGDGCCIPHISHVGAQDSKQLQRIWVTSELNSNKSWKKISTLGQEQF